jgi:hypothetical protein
MRASVSITRSPEDVDMTVPVHAVATSAFDPPDHLARKADPALGDEQHFAAIAESLEHSIADLSDRLDAERKAPGRTGQEAEILAEMGVVARSCLDALGPAFAGEQTSGPRVLR